MSNPKCPVCDKVVYVTEAIKALEQTWHKLCFKCAATAPEDPEGTEVRCGKKLSLTDYSERKRKGGGFSVPYCKNCYDKNFAPKGFGRAAACEVRK